MLTDTLIVTIAPTGGKWRKSQNPALPTQPVEIAEDVYRCYNAGAAVCALHARTLDDSPTCDPAIYRDMNGRIREMCDIVISNSTGGGLWGDMVHRREDGRLETRLDQRLSAVEGGAEMLECDAQFSYVYPGVVGDEEVLFELSWSRAVQLMSKVKEYGIKPKWGILSPADIEVAKRLIDEGYDEPPYHFGLVFSDGQSAGQAYTPARMEHTVRELPDNSIFTTEGSDLRALLHTILLGGHVRVGLEDNLYYQGEELGTNIKAVERIVRFGEDLGLKIASAAQVREFLRLKDPVPSA